LENDTILKVYFAPQHFHHLIGLQKLKDINEVRKSQLNNTIRIFKNIMAQKITIDNLKGSKYFHDIESRLKHFKQINTIVEFERIIIDFDSSLINTVITADYILFKKSNDNMFLNLFLTSDAANNGFQIPRTFLPDPTDYYTYKQKELKILSITKVPSRTKHRK